jgi:hypothetical protein
VSASTADVRIELTASAINLEELVVTGTAVAPAKARDRNSVATVNADEFQTFAPARISPPPERQGARRLRGPRQRHGWRAAHHHPRSGPLSLSDQPLLYVDGVR